MSSEYETSLRKAIDRLPRVRLAERPTTLEPMPRLSEHLGGPPLYIKRDDLTGLGMGGNKTRMLEFSFAHALAAGADTVVTGMAVQSNYSRQVAAACAKLGLECHLVLRPVREVDRHEVQGNHLLDLLFGAHVTILPERNNEAQAAAIDAKAASLREAGRKVYVPRGEDTVYLDAIAYAETALEIVEQCRMLGIEPEHLYVAALDTTQAGLVLGFRYLRSAIHVHGLSPSGVPSRAVSMAAMANRAAQVLELDMELAAEDFDNVNTFAGEGYGIPTQAGLEAMRTVARLEGIVLEPVYTGKAMSALMDDIQAQRLPKEKPVIFLHTGGAPALFAYAEDVLSVL